MQRQNSTEPDSDRKDLPCGVGAGFVEHGFKSPVLAVLCSLFCNLLRAVS